MSSDPLDDAQGAVLALHDLRSRQAAAIGEKIEADDAWRDAKADIEGRAPGKEPGMNEAKRNAWIRKAQGEEGDYLMAAQRLRNAQAELRSLEVEIAYHEDVLAVAKRQMDAAIAATRLRTAEIEAETALKRLVTPPF